MKAEILANLVNRRNLRETIEQYFFEQELQMPNDIELIDNLWRRKVREETKVELYLNECVSVTAHYTGHLNESGQAEGLGFCIYISGLEQGIIAGRYSQNKLNGTCIWVRRIMVAGCVSLHQAFETDRLSQDRSVWLLKICPTDGDTAIDGTTTHFYDGNLSGFHCYFAPATTEI